MQIKKYTLSLLLILSVLFSCLVTGYAREVTLVTVDWPPYYGEKLKDGGAISVIVKTAFEKAGYQTSLKFIPWVRALKKVESGKYDIVMGAYYTEKRSKDYLLSDPFYDVDVGLIALKSLGVTHYSGLEDLKKYKIGVPRGYSVTPEFDAATYLQKLDSRNPLINIRKLFKGRVQMIAQAFGVFRYEVSQSKQLKDSINDVVFLQPPLKKRSLFLMMSLKKADGAKVIKDFNQGLADIKKDGTYDKILKQYGFK